MNWFDRTLLVVAPRIATKRLQYQLAAQVVDKQLRKYEGASSGRRTGGWSGVGKSANAEIGAAASKLRRRARDLVQNNAWAAKGLSVIVSNMIGTGIEGQPKHDDKNLAKRAAKLWQKWTRTTACDFDGRNDFYGLQALAAETVVRDGAVLVRLRRGKYDPVPLKLQVLEVDFLDKSKGLDGVETDEDGLVVGYWLYAHHPGDNRVATRKSTLVPASDVLHIYWQNRPGQLHGASWFAPVMIPLRDLDQYEDAQLIRQKIASCFAVFIHDSVGDDTPSASTSNQKVRERLEPGIIETLPAGKDVKFANPPALDGFSDFVSAYLRKIAAGLGITYEALTGDLSKTNFSAGRMGWLEFHRNIEAWRWRMMIPQFCEPIWAAFKTAVNVHPKSRENIEDVEITWTPPRRELINPKEEIAANTQAIRSGQKTLSEVLREAGYDPEAVAQEMAEDLARLDRHGLILDSDPRNTTQQGQPRDKASASASAAASGRGGVSKAVRRWRDKAAESTSAAVA